MKAYSHITSLLLIVVMLVAASITVTAQTSFTSGQSSQPLESLLRADGTLNLQTGFNGTLDARGWTMVNEPGQPPRFLRAGRADEAANSSELNSPATAPGDALWDDRFGSLGVNGFVNAVSASSSGVGGRSAVYVGGRISKVGNVNVNNIARWNDAASSWSPLDNGVNGDVYAIAVSGSDVYVGGSFTLASDVAGTRGIAKWDGAKWSALGTGITGAVYAIAISGSEVYVGGTFTSASDELNTRNIAMWNGSNWSALGSGIGVPGQTNQQVNAIAVGGSDEVYVGGSFTTASDVPNTQNIAKWNKTNETWSALETGITGIVYAIASSGSDVYVGGNFTIVIGEMRSMLNIAKWNGTSWSALRTGVGVPGQTNQQVNAIAIGGSEVYVGGSFTAASDVPNTQNIAKWNGESWSALGSGVNQTVTALSAGVDGVYVGGRFNTAGIKPSFGFALWHTNIPDPDNNWDDRFGALNINGRIIAIAVSDSDVYVGGDFTMIGGVPANRIAVWKSVSRRWLPLGSGVTGGGTVNVDAIAVSGRDVYVGGAFSSAGGMSGTGNIAVWNNGWRRLGYGLLYQVEAIAVASDGVYAGGVIGEAYNCDPSIDPNCRVRVGRIARWNGVFWSDVGGGVSGPGPCVQVTALAASGNDVYVGGCFESAGRVPVPGTVSIAKWNSASGWSALGRGIGGDWLVFAIAVSGNDVFVGGNFFDVINQDGTSVSANRIAKWNSATNTWSPLGVDLHNGVANSPGVSALAVSGVNEVYVGGIFASVNNADGSLLIVNHIARWNKTNETWSSLGTGTNGAVNTIAVGVDSVYVGGGFTIAGNKPSNRFGLWHVPVDVQTKVDVKTTQVPREYILSQNYPNPFNPSTTIRYNIPKSGYVTLKVYNLVGHEIETLVSEKQPAGEHAIRWNPVGLPSGVYFYRLQAGDASSGSTQRFVATKKLLLVK